jgi:pimeloyl-ACP methyl ester carboxylesterase
MTSAPETVPDERELMTEVANRLGLERLPPVERVALDGDRIQLSALRWGLGPPKIVFLHGGGQNAHTWDNVALRLGRDALAVDLPGHGRSGWYDEPSYLPRAMARDVARVLEAYRPALVVGMSMGGLTAIALAGQRPELLRRLMLVDVSPGSTPERSADITEFGARDVFDSFEDIVEHTRRFRSEPEERSLRRSVIYNARRLPDGRWTWRADRRRLSSGEDRMAQLYDDLPRYWDDVAQLRVPTMVVLGGRSPIVQSQDVSRYRELVPGIEIVTIAESGHNVQGHVPDRLAALIAGFLERP